MLKPLMIAATVTIAAPVVCVADDTLLTIGDKAPAIDISHWLKGEQVEAFEEGKVYVMEFWATWCNPCIAAMPHHSELQEEYKDYVTFIGVSNEPLSKVVKFLFMEYPSDGKIQNDRIQYTLTTDPDGSVWDDYMKAADQTGIPCTFIVGKTGEIEFIGRPTGMDDALKQIVQDEWDRDAFKTKWAIKMEVMRIQRKGFKAMNAGRLDEALKLWDKTLELIPDDGNARLQKMTILLVAHKDYERGYALATEIVESSFHDAYLLNMIAWMIVDEDLEQRDLELALKASQRCNELTSHENPAYLDTLSTVFYRDGDLKSAIKWQEKAAEFAGDDAIGDGIRSRLEELRRESK